MTSPQKQKGSAYERSIVGYLRDCGFRVERTRAGWADDRGDIHGVVSPTGIAFTFECKNQKRLDLAGWVTELLAEVGHARGLVGAVVHKRRGTTRGDEQYATLPLGMLVQLLKEAGYQ